MFKNVRTNSKPMKHKKNKNLPTKPFTSEKKRKKIYVAVRLELDILRSLTRAFPLGQSVLVVLMDYFL